MKYELRFEDATIDVSDRALDFEPLGQRYVEFLGAWVRDTARRCSYHRQRLQTAGVRVDAINSFDAWQSIPLLGPHDLLTTDETALLPDEYRELMLRGLASLPPGQRITKKFVTTGSSGQRPKVSYFTQDDWNASNASIIRAFELHTPLTECARVFNVFNPAHVAGRCFEDAYNCWGAAVENRHFALVTDREIVGQLQNGVPELGGFNCLAAPPCLPPGVTIKKGGTVDGLLNADVDNFIGRNIRLILTAGAPRDLPEFRLRERVWEANDLAGAPRTRFIDIYGSSEICVGCAECEHGSLHPSPGFVYTEVINDKTGKHAKNGERGLVVWTGLRHGSRFLRYVIGDEATWVTDPCKCGRATPRLVDVQRVMDKDRIRQGCAAV